MDAGLVRESAQPGAPGYARQHDQPSVIAVQEQDNETEDHLLPAELIVFRRMTGHLVLTGDLTVTIEQGCCSTDR